MPNKYYCTFISNATTYTETNKYEKCTIFKRRLKSPNIIIVNVCVLGYKPCDPQVVHDRMSHLDAAYEELLQLAIDRRNKLEESRKLWQFYWDMADEEGWIKEKEQLMSSPDLGHDLTSVHLLLNKHKVTSDTIYILHLKCWTIT